MSRSDSFKTKWASTPAQFERPTDALIERGWAGGAAEDPPEAKWENWWHNRVDEALAEIERSGAMQWFPDVPYAVGAPVRSGGKNWIAAIANEGVEPGSPDDEGQWQELSLLRASQEDAELGEDNSKIATILRVFQAMRSGAANATEALRGTLRLATPEQAQELTSDDVAITPATLGSAMNAYVLGMGQTWVNMSANRVINTTYTNTSGRSIMVSVSGKAPISGNSYIYLLLDNDILSANSARDVNELNLSTSGVIPSGSTYKVEASGALSTVRWMELR